MGFLDTIVDLAAPFIQADQQRKAQAELARIQADAQVKIAQAQATAQTVTAETSRETAIPRLILIGGAVLVAGILAVSLLRRG